jgi:hypothetical protein
LNPIKKLIGLTLTKAPWLGAPLLHHPVFIVGSGRSGTTYLQSLLEKHPDIIGFPGEANELWHVNAYPYHEKRPPVDPIWVNPEFFTEFSVNSWPFGWKSYIKGQFGAYFRFSHKKIFLQKTVMNNFMLNKMLEMYPKAKFVYLVRNGWSVALSYQKKELEKYSHSIYRKYVDLEDLNRVREIHAKYWNDTIVRVEEDKKKYFSDSNFLEIRYENLVAKPEETIKEILSFIGLPYSDNSEFIAAVAGVTDKNYKAKSELDPLELAELEKIMSPALSLKGYLK